MLRKDAVGLSVLVLAVLSSRMWLLQAGEVKDSGGFMWDIQADGSINDGTDDTFDGGLGLEVNGKRFRGAGLRQGVSVREWIVDPQQMGDLKVMRKVIVPENHACVVFLEIIENIGERRSTFNLSLVSDPGGDRFRLQAPASKQPHSCYGVLVQGGEACCVGRRYATDGALVGVTANNRGDMIDENFTPIALGPHKKVAVIHVAAQRRGVDEALDFAKSIDLDKLLRELSKEDLRLVVNVRSSDALFELGGLELIRGGTSDSIKLQSGETLTGMLKTDALTLATGFGELRCEVARILSLFSAPDGMIRVVLENGEVLTGRPKESALVLQLRGGTDLTVPLERVAGYGRRLPPEAVPALSKVDQEEDQDAPTAKKKEDHRERFVFTEPIFILRGGDRLIGQLTVAKVALHTLYGELSVPVSALKSITFSSSELRVPIIVLKDGSLFSGLLATSDLDFRRAGATLKLDAGRLEAILFVPNEEAEMDADPRKNGTPSPYQEPLLRLVNGDRLRGRLHAVNGEMHIETPFGEQRTGCDQIRALRSRAGAPQGVRVTLWDGAMLPGRLKQGRIPFKTLGGQELSISVEMAEHYDDPFALPPDKEKQELDAVVAQLGDTDVKVREAAHVALTRQGAAARGVLVRHWDHEDLETRNRVRMISARIPQTEDE